jgi:hypothetical protein
MFGAMAAASANAIPDHLRKKTLRRPPVQMRKFNWTKIEASKIGKDTFWAHANEEKYVKRIGFEDLQQMFASGSAKGDCF